MIVAVLIVAVIVAALQMQRRRGDGCGTASDRNTSRSSPTSAARRAESELADREERREALDIRPLDPDARGQYSAAWQDVQARFVAHARARPSARPIASSTR